MLAITIALLLCQHLSATWSTRLPLEVYELTSSAAATTTAHDLQYFQQQQKQHTNLEYATVNADHQQQKNHLQNDTKPSTTARATAAAAAATATATTTTTADVTTNSHQQLDRRRSRQMLDIIQQQQQQQQQHHFDHSAMQHHMHHIHQQQQRLSKDVRILYQVGESEDDLPVCAFNAVCSKIDLYETPWIERQCRCPPTIGGHSPNIIIHHHNNDNNNNNSDNDSSSDNNNNNDEASSTNRNSNKNDNSNNNNQFQESLEASRYAHTFVHSNNNKNNNYNNNNNNYNNNNNNNKNNHQQQQQHSDKYHAYYEQEKLLQRKHLLVSGDFIADKRFENLHLKKLMQKLGAIYEDDLDMEASDFLETNEDSDSSHHYHHHDGLNFEDTLSENEFPNMRKNSHVQQQQSTKPLTSTHMRHSGHGHRIKELSYIGGCPSGLGIEDGHTIVDKTRHYKLCSPVHKLPVCKHFRDYTWTLTMSAELNVTEQIIHCRCPKSSVTYLTKREPSMDGSGGFAYLFACSPVTRIRCQRKQPCKLFTVRKRQEFLDEVNLNVLCQCPKGHHCPSHHTQGGVIPGESFLEDNIQTYSGYCMAND